MSTPSIVLTAPQPPTLSFTLPSQTFVSVTGGGPFFGLNVIGQGGTTVYTLGGLLLISGGAGGGGGSYDPLGTAANTGQILYGLITGLSGISPAQYTSVPWQSSLLLGGSTPQSNNRILMTGNMMVNTPVGGLDGNRVKLWIEASGNATSWNLSLAGGIRVPTSSTFTSPQAIASGTKAKVLLEYDAVLNGGQWELTSFINGY